MLVFEQIQRGRKYNLIVSITKNVCILFAENSLRP